MSIEVADVIAPDVRKTIKEGLDQHARLNGVPPRLSLPLSVIKRNEQGVFEGGLTGETFWDLLYVDEFWVQPGLRGKGTGRALLKAAEEEALKRGCTRAYLWTGDWNAPGFYAKLGYKDFAQLPDFPPGHVRTGFMKRLAP